MNINLIVFAVAVAAVAVAALVGVFWILPEGPRQPHALEEIPPRLMDALEADSGHRDDLRLPNEGFWNAFHRKHPQLMAAVEFDEQLTAENRARYDTFWTALRDQDDDFWHALDHGDHQLWAQLEREHAVSFPVLNPTDAEALT